MENKKSHKKSFRIYLSIVAVLLLLQVVAWSSRSLSDAYIDYIFPIWVNTYGRITGLFPFSVGEGWLWQGFWWCLLRLCWDAVCWFRVQTFGKVLPGSEGIFWFFCMDVACRICHYDAELYHDLSWVYIFGEIFRWRGSAGADNTGTNGGTASDLQWYRPAL